ncbi:MAG: hypothetical protein IPO78_00725 [Saprospiraceae bacterium]|nr:hypothetical protein [Saprospiraceae bacterium]MBK8450304.1 hypothetical protein [Saprospiraceae bacterium]MBK9222835.1 hypothetical protein [Saprospiraceae bacterium]MBK9720124.1 hypothetical protein [Saprospiraceae bacterium]MBK9727118.1 hypothetical protein [Saprospiraceae bacterium]
MKRIFFITLFLISKLIIGTAQDDPEMRPEGKQRMMEKMEAMRVAFLTNKLDLTTEESTHFWPVYNEFSKKRMELRKDLIFHKRDARKNEMTDEESKKALEDQFNIQEKELSLKKNYYEKFKAILPSKKLAKLEPAEMEFNQEVIRKLKERRENRIGKRNKY